MHARIVTLRFSPSLGGFDDSALQSLLRSQQVLSCREHVVQVEGLPYIVCIVTWLDAAAHLRDGAPPARGEVPPPAAVLVGGVAEPEPADADASSHATVAASHATPSPANGDPARPHPASSLQGPRRVLFEAMRRWRSATAHREGVPPYVILTNRQLVEIVQRLPRSVTALGEIHGLGDKKLQRHGQAILMALVEAVREAKASAPDGGCPAADAARHDAAGHDAAGHDAAGHDAAGQDAAGHDAAGQGDVGGSPAVVAPGASDHDTAAPVEVAAS